MAVLGSVAVLPHALISVFAGTLNDLQTVALLLSGCARWCLIFALLWRDLNEFSDLTLSAFLIGQ